VRDGAGILIAWIVLAACYLAALGLFVAGELITVNRLTDPRREDGDAR